MSTKNEEPTTKEQRRQRIFAGVATFLAIYGLNLLMRTGAYALGSLVSLPAGGEAWRSLLFLVVVAFVTMSLIQVFRSLVRVRGWFHRFHIERWCRLTEQEILTWRESHTKGVAPLSDEKKKEDLDKKAAEDIGGLLRLANVNDGAVFFDAPIEQIFGQFSAVTELLLSEVPQPVDPSSDGGSASASKTLIPPWGSEGAKVPPMHLLAVLTGQNWVIGVGKSLDLDWSVEPQEPQPPVAEGSSAPAAEVQVPPVVRKGITDPDLRGKLGYSVQRSLDQLQIAISSRWRWRVRLTAVVISCAIALSAVHVKPLLKANAEDAFFGGAANLVTALLAGVISGYLATVFRDLISIVERMRR